MVYVIRFKTGHMNSLIFPESNLRKQRKYKMKVDVKMDTDKYKLGLFKGSVERKIAKVTVTLDEDELDKLQYWANSEKSHDATFFDYEIFAPSMEDFNLGALTVGHFIKSLEKGGGSYTKELYCETPLAIDQAVKDFTQSLKNLKDHFDTYQSQSVQEGSFEI